MMQGYWTQSSELGMLDPTAASLLPPIWEGQPNENVTSFKFLSGVIIWLDILDCITSGIAPGLLTLHSHALSPGSHIRMETIIGSSNWAILQIVSTGMTDIVTPLIACSLPRSTINANLSYFT